MTESKDHIERVNSDNEQKVVSFGYDINDLDIEETSLIYFSAEDIEQYFKNNDITVDAETALQNNVSIEKDISQ